MNDDDKSPRGVRLWGGRFDGTTDPVIDAFTRSFSFDRRIARDDLVGSLAHARMLFERGVIDGPDARTILEGLAAMLRELEAGELVPSGDFEDIHAWIESTLTERVGSAGRRLHTARSRNDQIAVSLRLYVRRRSLEILDGIVALAEHWSARAAEHLETLLPGYTHLQRGQPISLAHHLLAHAHSLLADADRFRRLFGVAGCSPLGAGALAGTGHDIDPQRTAELLGFESVFPNSVFAVADRDYVVEASFACALLLVHLSRWAEEVVLWATTEFRFVRLDDSVAKGSSIMPQKKNPEPAEILRGKSGRVIGDLVAHLVQLKGLALAYNSDLQEDKEALFDALDTAHGALGVALVLQRGLRFDRERMERATVGGFVVATDLADELVRRGVTFRDAHELAGRAVREAEARDCRLVELPLDVLREISPLIDEEVRGSLTPLASLHSHASHGGPAPVRVREQLVGMEHRLHELRHWRSERQEEPIVHLVRKGRVSEERKEPS